MEEMEVQETTQELTESQTEIQTENQEQESTTQTQTENPSSSEHDTIELLPDNSENIIHELFYELGVDLDYTPVNGFQCFTMTLQFLAALWFIWWFVKYLFSVMRSFFSSRW